MGVGAATQEMAQQVVVGRLCIAIGIVTVTECLGFRAIHEAKMVVFEGCCTLWGFMQWHSCSAHCHLQVCSRLRPLAQRQSAACRHPEAGDLQGRMGQGSHSILDHRPEGSYIAGVQGEYLKVPVEGPCRAWQLQEGDCGVNVADMHHMATLV